MKIVLDGFWDFGVFGFGSLRASDPTRNLKAACDKLDMAIAMLRTNTHFSVGVDIATQAAMNKRYSKAISTRSIA